MVEVHKGFYRIIRTGPDVFQTEPDPRDEVLANHLSLAGRVHKLGLLTHYGSFNRPEADAALMEVEDQSHTIFIWGCGQGIDLPAEAEARQKTAATVATHNPDYKVLYSIETNKPTQWTEYSKMNA